jgi:hypothetical protein
MCNFSQVPVIPAKAGIHCFIGAMRIPDFAGMTGKSCTLRIFGDERAVFRRWIYLSYLQYREIYSRISTLLNPAAKK